jgi:hypothetical protein
VRPAGTIGFIVSDEFFTLSIDCGEIPLLAKRELFSAQLRKLHNSILRCAEARAMPRCSATLKGQRSNQSPWACAVFEVTS